MSSTGVILGPHEQPQGRLNLFARNAATLPFELLVSGSSVASSASCSGLSFEPELEETFGRRVFHTRFF